MEVTERAPLLVNNSTKEKEKIDNSKPTFSWTQYICLNLVILLHTVSGVVESNVLSLYIYGRFESEYGDNTTSDTGTNNMSVTSSPNTTTACGSNSKSEDVAQVMSSTWLWYFSMTSYGCLLISLPITGLWIDVLGRKPFLLLSLFGTISVYLVKAYLIYQKYDVVYFFTLSVIGGLTGSGSSFSVAALAFIADVTPPNKSRAFFFAIYEVMTGIGEGAVQIGAGYLIQDTGYVLPCLVASGLCLICALITILVLNETVSEKQRRAKHSVLDLFRRFVGFYHNKKYLKTNAAIWKFNLTILIYMVRLCTASSVGTLFMLGSPFCFKAVDIGWFNSASYMVKYVLGVAVMRLLQFCFKDEIIGALGLLSSIGDKIIFFFASARWMLYSATGVGVLSGLTTPVLRAILSKMVLGEQHGAIFANLTIMGILIDIGSVSAYNNIYKLTEHWRRGFIYIIMSGVVSISLLLFIPLICSKDSQVCQEETTVKSDENSTKV